MCVQPNGRGTASVAQVVGRAGGDWPLAEETGDSEWLREFALCLNDKQLQVYNEGKTFNIEMPLFASIN